MTATMSAAEYGSPLGTLLRLSQAPALIVDAVFAIIS